jgi:hypothetical protein
MELESLLRPAQESFKREQLQNPSPCDSETIDGKEFWGIANYM